MPELAARVSWARDALQRLLKALGSVAGAPLIGDGAGGVTPAVVDALGLLVTGDELGTAALSSLLASDATPAGTLSAQAVAESLGRSLVAKCDPSAPLSSTGTGTLAVASPAGGLGAGAGQPDPDCDLLSVAGAEKCTVVHAPPGANELPATGEETRPVSPRSRAALPVLVVDGCADCFLYLLRPFRHCLVRACTRTTIVLGAVAGTLSVDLCENCTVVAACSQLRVGNTVETLASCFTPHRPIVFGDCRGLRLAPHSAPYNGLAAHMVGAGFATPADLARVGAPTDGKVRLLVRTAGRWKDPITLAGRQRQHRASTPGDERRPVGCHAKVEPALPSAEGGSGAAAGGAGAEVAGSPAGRRSRTGVSLLRPSKFSILMVPAPTGPARATDQAVPLPEAYASAVSRRRRALSQLRGSIRESGLSKPQEDQLQAAIQAHFRDWLVSSGNIRQVIDLVRLHRAASGDGVVAGGTGAAQPLQAPPPAKPGLTMSPIAPGAAAPAGAGAAGRGGVTLLSAPASKR